MKTLSDLSSLSPKQLRTLRNNLNNRLRSFEQAGERVKELQKSHILYGKTEQECQALLQQVVKELVKLKN